MSLTNLANCHHKLMNKISSVLGLTSAGRCTRTSPVPVEPIAEG